MIITIANKSEKTEIKDSYPDSFAFIKTIEDDKIIILFKTKGFFGKYNITTKEFFTIANKYKLNL